MSWLEQLTGDTLIVHLRSDTASLKGVVVGTHEDCLVLRDALVLDVETTTPLDGAVVVPRENVDFCQRVA